MSSNKFKHWQSGKSATAPDGANAQQKKDETTTATNAAAGTAVTGSGGLPHGAEHTLSGPQQPLHTVATSPSVRESRMSPGERNRIMIEQMRKLGIARANAAYHVADFAQKMTGESVLSGIPLRVLNAYLNEGFDTRKDIGAQTVTAHRTARCKALLGDVAPLVSKKSLVPLVQAMMLAAIDPAEVGRAVDSITALRGKEKQQMTEQSHQATRE